MSSADKLLKTAIIFERLALYIDRKSFLRALSSVSDPLGNDIKQKLDSVISDLAAVAPHTTTLQNSLMDFISGKSSDKKQLVDNLYKAFQSLPNKNITQKQNLNDLIVNLEGKYFPFTSEEKKENIITLPNTTISAFPKINPQIQSALSKILSLEGASIPITVDGILGPETRNALQLFKKKFNLTNLNTDKLLQAVLIKAKDPRYSWSPQLDNELYKV
jgi:hypothetical protein